jgi:uncharacterized protein (DUF2236 family)
MLTSTVVHAMVDHRRCQKGRAPMPTRLSEQEARALTLGPDSMSWRYSSDLRLFLGSLTALLMQVAHPTVGSGVRDHSNFQADPWGRLMRTTDYLFLLVYGGAAARPMGRRLRELHKQIKGTNPDGSRYHALEPEAYAWVHATLIEASFATGERFVGGLTAADCDRLYAEYMPLGRLVGIQPGDLPETRAEFRDYVDEMIAERLERTETVDLLLSLLDRPAAPGVPVIDQLWPLLRLAPSRALRTATLGLLPPVLRERFGVAWSDAQQAELRAFGAASRALGPALPARLRNVGPEYLRRRREAIGRGPLGEGAEPLARAA